MQLLAHWPTLTVVQKGHPSICKAPSHGPTRRVQRLLILANMQARLDDAATYRELRALNGETGAASRRLQKDLREVRWKLVLLAFGSLNKMSRLFLIGACFR